MIKSISTCIILLAFSFQLSFAQLSKIVFIHPKRLQSVKEAYKKGDQKVMDEVQYIIRKADGFLGLKPKSVMDKSFTPPSGSKHDYMSLAPYFWPDPSKPDGLPYIRKDGQRNPEIKEITDGTNMKNMSDMCQFLSLAYFFSGQDKYAAKAKELLSIWFLNPETKMNPNLNYAQAIKGVNDGRGIGIIETRSLADLADWMQIMTTSKSFTPGDLDQIKDWYKQYLHWMLTSKNGNDEHDAKNNHGTIYDMQTASFALFTGDKEKAKQILTASLKRLSIQLEPDGQQPLELERTNAYGYSTLNLSNWFNIALLGEQVGLDVWTYKIPNGANLQKALDWLIPYTLNDKKKEYQQISPYDKTEMYKILVLAGAHYKDNTYLKKANSIPENEETRLIDLLY